MEDARWLKPMCVFYSLKTLYQGGIILNISKRYGELADRLDISETNLRSKVKFLKDNGLVYKDKNNLYFIGFNKIRSKFKLKTHKGDKIAYQKPKDLEIYIKSLVLKENLERQEHIVQKKIIREELRKFGKIQAKGALMKIRKKIKANISYLTEKYKRRGFSDFTHNGYRKINSDVSLSRQRISHIFGKKSKSTGTRFLTKAKNKGLVFEDLKRIEKTNVKITIGVLRKLDLDSSFFIFKNKLFKRYANKLTFVNFIA